MFLHQVTLTVSGSIPKKACLVMGTKTYAKTLAASVLQVKLQRPPRRQICSPQGMSCPPSCFSPLPLVINSFRSALMSSISSILSNAGSLELDCTIKLDLRPGLTLIGGENALTKSKPTYTAPAPNHGNYWYSGHSMREPSHRARGHLRLLGNMICAKDDVKITDESNRSKSFD